MNAAVAHATRAAFTKASMTFRSGEMLRRVTRCIDDAHQAEGTVVYHHRDFPAFADAARPGRDQGLGL